MYCIDVDERTDAVVEGFGELGADVGDDDNEDDDGDDARSDMGASSSGTQLVPADTHAERPDRVLAQLQNTIDNNTALVRQYLIATLTQYSLVTVPVANEFGNGNTITSGWKPFYLILSIFLLYNIPGPR